MKEFICDSCGSRFSMEELPDYAGECPVCGGEIPVDEEEFDKEQY